VETGALERPLRTSTFSPWAIGLFVFLAYPVVSSIVHSFCDYSVRRRRAGSALELHRPVPGRGWCRAEEHALYAVSLLLATVALFFALRSTRSCGSSIYRTLLFVDAGPVVAGRASGYGC
jgi:ABC-type sugar transport system permease subunit